MARGPAEGLALLDGLAGNPVLEEYPYFHASRADLLRRLGVLGPAAAAYRSALLLTTNDVERAFLAGRIDEVERRIALPG
jgi:RNA polymerase sigma-70 factor (ECF subfamily)